jgi:hypothetical protein
MSVNDRKIRTKRTITVISCSLLIVISLITFQQQIPTIAHTTKIYDKKYISALRYIGDTIPQNATLAATENYPQVTYFTGHKVKVPWVNSERSLVQFMWKVNSSYLLVPEDTFEAPPDNTPLLIQVAQKPFEKIFDYYNQYVSKIKSQNTHLLNASNIKQDNNRPLNMTDSIKEEPFQKLFEKILDYNTEGSILHLYHLRSNITRDNLAVITDKTRPTLFVSLPINGTVMETKFGVLRVNVTGTAIDADSKIKTVEVSIGGLPYQLANPRAPGDWSTWSFSDYVTHEGTKEIMVRATDNADNRAWVPVHIIVK